MPGEELPCAVVYARTASASKADQDDIGRQLRVCREVAAELHATLDREFADHGISGSTLNRVGIRQLLVYVAANPIDYVICADAARLSCNYELRKWLTRELRIRHAQVVFVVDDTSLEAADGQTNR